MIYKNQHLVRNQKCDPIINFGRAAAERFGIAGDVQGILIATSVCYVTAYCDTCSSTVLNGAC